MQEQQETPQTQELGIWVVVDPDDLFEKKGQADKRNELSYNSLHKVIEIEIKQNMPDNAIWEGWAVVDPDDFFETKKGADKRNMLSYNSLHKVIYIESDNQEEQEESSSFPKRYTKIFIGLLVLAIVAFGINYLYPRIFGSKTVPGPTPSEVSAADSTANALNTLDTASLTQPETPEAGMAPAVDPAAVAPVPAPAKASAPVPATRSTTSAAPAKLVVPNEIPVLKPDPKVKFYVVIASFETQRRAKTFIRQLAAQGVRADIVTYGESLHRVITGGFTDEAAAEKSREAIKAQPLCEGAWVLNNN